MAATAEPKEKTEPVEKQLTKAELREAASRLPMGERLDLANELFDDCAPSTPLEKGDLSEVLRERIRQIEAGEDVLVPWEEVRREGREIVERVRREREQGR
jgi:hypothetical protein